MARVRGGGKVRFSTLSMTLSGAYRYPIGGDEIDRAIYLGENRCSAGYDRFVRKESGT